MSLAIAFCPHPPLLVPAVDASQVAELVELRTAARSAVKELVATAPSRIVVVGTTARPTRLDDSAGADFGPYGVRFAVGGPSRSLELPHAVGAWLLDDAGWTGPRTYTDQPVDGAEGVAWLVMADGTTKRTVRAPGSFDERAEGYDGTVVAALESGDPGQLAALDVEIGLTLGAAAAPMLAAVGHALATRGPAVPHVRFDRAPLGVGSWVADWTFA